MTELKKRVLVAIISVPIALTIIFIGGTIFSLVIAIISTIGLWEFYKMAENKEYYVNKIWGIIWGILPIIYIEARRLLNFDVKNDFFYTLLLLYVFLFIVSTLLISLFSKRENSIASLGVTFVGYCYVSLSFLTFILLGEEISQIMLIFIFISVWVCDSAAFFIGRKFGKHKLMPNISPKKTIEGAIAGFFASIFCFVGLRLLYNMEWISGEYTYSNTNNLFFWSVLFGVVIGIFGQLGDLIESRLKRDAGVKDSSNIIPGHGGILDRFDSLIIIIPILYFIQKLMGLWCSPF